MRSKKIISALITATLLLIFFACQQGENKTETAPVADLDFSLTTQSTEALNQFTEGLTAFDLGDRDRARPYFDKAMELDPDFVMAYVYRAWFSRSAQEYDKYTKMANEKNKNLSEAEQLMVELNNAYATNDVPKRMSVGKTMVEKFPEIARSYIVLGNAYESSNDYSNARKNFNKAIELRPNWIVGYSNLGRSYIDDEPKDLAKAEENMKKVVELMPNESRVHIGLGDVYRAQGDLGKALASYQKAASLAPDDDQAYTKAGHANVFLGNYEEARKDYKKAGALSSYPAASLNNIAYTYLYAGEHAEGLAYLKGQISTLDEAGLPADQLMGSKINVLNKCLWTAFYLKDAKEMKALLAQIQPLDMERTESVNSPERMAMYKGRMNYKEGMLALLQGDLETAKEKAAAQKEDLATINNPNKLEDYYLLLGEIAMKENKYGDAVAQLEKTDKDDMYAKYMLAQANKKAGNEEKANQLFKDILAIKWTNLGSALVRNDVKAMLPPSS